MRSPLGSALCSHGVLEITGLWNSAVHYLQILLPGSATL
jgi:hypothetical protein